MSSYSATQCDMCGLREYSEAPKRWRRIRVEKQRDGEELDVDVCEGCWSTRVGDLSNRETWWKPGQRRPRP